MRESATSLFSEAPAQRFRGSVVKSYLERGWPFDLVLVNRSHVVLKRTFGADVVINRDAVRHVVVTPHRMPLLTRTTFELQREDVDDRLLFVPYRAGRFRRCLEDFGWPVVAGAPGNNNSDG